MSYASVMSYLWPSLPAAEESHGAERASRWRIMVSGTGERRKEEETKRGGGKRGTKGRGQAGREGVKWGEGRRMEGSFFFFFFLSSFFFPTLPSPPPSFPPLFLPFILHLFLRNKMILLEKGKEAEEPKYPSKNLASNKHQPPPMWMRSFGILQPFQWPFDYTLYMSSGRIIAEELLISMWDITNNKLL